MQTFKKLEKLMKDNFISDVDLSRATIPVDPDGFGLTSGHIGKIRKAHMNPTINTMVILCKAISTLLKKKVKIDDLIDD
ncbi:MAG: hypothetical protein WCI04_06330 [archaeon]